MDPFLERLMANFDQARTKMIDSQIRTVDVTDHAVLAAVGSVPREEFVPTRLKPLAYIDADLELKAADEAAGPRHMMQPAPFARLLQLGKIGRDDFALIVGCGTGYSAAVMAQLVDSVVAVESDEDLASQASEKLTDLEIDNVAVVVGPLEEGYASEGPYDVIFVDGSVGFVPEGLVDQLKENGRMVVVIGRGGSANAALFIRSGQEVSSRNAFNADVPPLPGFQVAPEFVF